MAFAKRFEQDIIRCHNTQKADVRFQDGGLRHAIGTHCIQVMRAGKDPGTAVDGFGWTYNHAAMLCYFKGHFFLDYLSGPVSEHLPPSQTLLTWSKDGLSWTKPKVLFPPIEVDSAPYRGPAKEDCSSPRVSCVMHQRMSFYVTKSGRLLATAFYGIAPNHGITPNNGYGVGRVVREIYPIEKKEDFAFSDIYFLRFNEKGGYTPENTKNYPSFRDSSDAGFIAACEELLSNRLVTQQMWEEERLNTDFFTQPGAEAISYYTRPDGDVVGLYKNSLVTKSSDRGETWSELETDYSLETSTGKVWGQRTWDGRYCLAYNPTTDSAHRWPIAVISSDNGRDFDDLLAVTPEVSPHKYAGLYKNLGPQYIRGIIEDNPQPEDEALWLAYTVNKEDVWVSRTPLPLHGTETAPVREDFSSYEASSYVDTWNLYSPMWARVSLVQTETEGKCLLLKDSDPYDRGRAMRTFPTCAALRANTRICLNSRAEKSCFTIEIQNQYGMSPIRFYFTQKGELVVKNGGRYDTLCSIKMGVWMDVLVEANCLTNQFTLNLRQENFTFEKAFRFSLSVDTLERILYTTKASLPFNTLEDCGKWGDLGDLEDADVPLVESSYYIASLEITEISGENTR